MFKHHLIRRSLVASLAIGAAGLPAAAQARVEPPDSPYWAVAVPAPVVGGSSVKQEDQLQSTVRKRFAAEGGWPSASSVSSTATSQGDFDWGDAGIGAAGAIVLLGGAAAGTGMSRRRRVARSATR